MKIIDGKGRIFGKINVIDFLVILFLLCLMPMFYFGYKIFSRKPIAIQIEEAKFIEIETDCLFIELRPEVSKLIAIGDKELDENGQVIGEIVKLGESKPYALEFDIGGGKKIVKENEFLKQVEAKLKLKSEIKNSNLYYKGKAIRVNSPLEFKTNKYSLIGTVIVARRAEEKWLSLAVNFSGLAPEITAAVHEGDIEKDFSSSKILARIQSVRSMNPSQVLSVRENEIITLNHPFNKDILVFLQVLCVKKEGAYYFKNYPIKIGSSIIFCTDFYSISGIIVGMETK